MSDNAVAALYLSALVIALFGISIFILRQVLRTRRTESRLSQLQNLVKQDQATAKDCYELGSIYLNKKLYSQAGKLFQKALRDKKTEPENRALIYNALGYAYFSQEQLDLAIRQYKEALKLYPDYVVALNNLGHVYERKNLTSQALEAYEQALVHDPQDSVAQKRSEALRKRLPTTSSSDS